MPRKKTHPAALRRIPLRLGRWRERYREAGLSVILGLQATTIFVVSPLAGTGMVSPQIIDVLRVGLAATAILVVNRIRAIGAIAVVTFAASFVCTMYLRGGAAGQTVYLANILFTTVFDVAVAGTVAHAAFGAGRITIHRILGGLILYLYVALIFANLYRLAASQLHPAFAGLAPGLKTNFSQLLYFSLCTLTTSSVADILPVHPFIRSLSNLESVIGQLYPATFLARLVTLYGRARVRSDDAD